MGWLNINETEGIATSSDNNTSGSISDTTMDIKPIAPKPITGDIPITVPDISGIEQRETAEVLGRVNESGAQSNLTKVGKVAGIAGQVADIGKGFIELDENQQRYGASDTNTTDTLSSAVMMAGPVGAIVGGAMKVGSLAGKVFESNVDYTKYGQSSQDQLGYQVAGSILDPFTTGAKNSKAQAKIGNDSVLNTIGGYIPGIGGFLADEATDKAGDYMEEADIYKSELEARYKDSQENLSINKNRYTRALSEANRIYGNNGQMRVALYGGIVSKKLLDIIIEKEKIDRIKPKFVPMKLGSGNIQALKGGGSVIPSGVLHNELNKIGDKGIPLVYKGYKVMEIELNELVLHDKPTERIKELKVLYSKTKDKKILLEIGNIMHNEINENTHSYTEKFGCLNNNTCKI